MAAPALMLLVGAACMAAPTSPSDGGAAAQTPTAVSTQPTEVTATWQPPADDPFAEAPGATPSAPSGAVGGNGLGRFALIPDAERQTPPNFEMVTTSGAPVDLASRQGKVVFLYQTAF
jgi:hypothetical protein